MSRRRGLRVLLDTSFILPTLGIDVKGDVIDTLIKLKESNANIYYSKLSIVEALWVAIAVMKKGRFDEERFNLGLKSILESNRYNLAPENAEVHLNSMRMYRLGHMDIIDNLLYSTAFVNNLKFLTIDNELERFIARNNLPDVILKPSDL